jgi:hypothetical protein
MTETTIEDPHKTKNPRKIAMIKPNINYIFAGENLILCFF